MILHSSEFLGLFFLMIRRPPRSTLDRSSAASDVYKRQIVNKPLPPIQKGSIANLSIFAINEEWQFEKKDIKSKSKNTPFIGTKLKGRVKGIFHKGKLNLNY